MIRDVFSWTTQILVWFIITPLYLIFFKIKIYNRENFSELKPPMIIVTNHIQWHDPWFIRFVLGFNSPLVPRRFMASKIFTNQFTQLMYYIGLIPFIYFLFGAFTIEQGKGLSVNLLTARKIVKNGGVVILFPEGRMNKFGSIGEFLSFKKGAAALAIEEGVSILPMFIKRKYNRNWFRDELTIKVGKAFNIENIKSIEYGTEMIKKAIVELVK